jgi:arginyl-tRNA synthetase
MIKGIEQLVSKVFQEQYGEAPSAESIQIQETRKDFEGDFTIVVFPLVRIAKSKPEEVAETLGNLLVDNVLEIEKFNVVKGFLNISLTSSFWTNWLSNLSSINSRLPKAESRGELMVEYSSPNTNKPLHLGHIRNNLLGYSVSEILKSAGYKVYKTQIVNDRGIHICKSMIAWEKFGNGETPESSGLKGDKLVGKYYVAFDKAYKAEMLELTASGKTEEEAKKEAPIIQEAQAMLMKWEGGDEKVNQLWETMNAWVYAGFDKTYARLGVDFDKLYYESNTYLYGKDKVTGNIENGIFYKKEDGSVWCDLTNDGLDNKLVIRADGTTVYMTQDIGTALLRLEDFPKIKQLIYTVGNEQDYHFKVLFKILEKLGYSWASNCYHLSYGMVDLPTGKMKSREGTVVDADDLMEEMSQKAKEITTDLGKLEDLEETEKEVLYNSIGMAALKYFMLKVDPKKKMLFNPEESIDFNGNTGPFIQYTHARIQAILRRGKERRSVPFAEFELEDKEKSVLRLVKKLPEIIEESAVNYSPAVLCNYLYDLVKAYNSFYQSMPIFDDENAGQESFRIELTKQAGETIGFCLTLLGINAPERM